MKKTVVLISLFLLFTTFLTSCEIENCKHCKTIVADKKGNIISETELVEYCDEELEEMSNDNQDWLYELAIDYLF